MTIEQSACPFTGATLDHHSPEFRADPYAIFKELRAACPMARSDQYGGFWAFLDYDSVFDAARDDDLFNSYPSVGVPASGMPYPILPIESDPPLTKQLRAITLKQFSPQVAEELRPQVRQMAQDMVDEFIERGHCDIVAELTTPLPAKTMLHVLGFDETRYLEWVKWVHTVVHDRTQDEDTAAAAGMELFGEIGKHMQERREGALGDDLFGRILSGQVDGVPLDDIQITMYTFLMMLGGMDTTSGLTGNALLRMIEQPELRQTLIDEPDMLKPATEEFLRHSSPTLGLARTVSRDTDFHGQNLQAGDRAILMWAAANHDPDVFESPETIDFWRDNKRHLAFGVGQHRCLGSHLARMMFQEMISEILERLPDFELDGEAELFEDAGEVHAVRHLPIRFTPGARRAATAPQ
ncbi:cytochrome P450 [Williamsia sp. DF01-3]|uniref:cytochrome P450 n=1 Tax=Williamsia sp. DF01-3 TaxID=2934157 RepID=UPI001FF4ED72|nr:cytochrome P450 [Williamsia sp. DF01-3]MCK0516776.1 cytochrome P450 [Williamsia sp. DF01-3]